MVALRVVVLSMLFGSGAAWAYSGGIANTTWGGANSAVGCMGCHTNGVGTSTPTQVSFTGGQVVTAMTTVKYTLTVNVGTAAAAGVTVSAFSPAGGAAQGQLSLCSAAVDATCGNLKLTGTDVTQTTPHAKNAVNQVAFSFNYTAPSTPTAGCYQDKLEVWVAGVNLNGTTTGDQAARFDLFISNNGSTCGTDGQPCTVDACNATGACAHAAGNNGTQCSAPSCTDGTETLAATCNGTATTCPAATTQACNGFSCGATACLATCAGDADCLTGFFCDGTQACVAKLGDGTACDTDDECQSTHCADHVCCATACSEQCGACNLSATIGTCTAVTGAPVGGRTACESDGSPCGGSCDGVALAACAYPDASVACGDASCSGGIATTGATCDGAGKCPAATTQACGNGEYCVSGTCVPQQGDGEACEAAQECSSGMCADNVCGAPHGGGCASDGSPSGLVALSLGMLFVGRRRRRTS